MALKVGSLFETRVSVPASASSRVAAKVPATARIAIIASTGHGRRTAKAAMRPNIRLPFTGEGYEAHLKAASVRLIGNRREAVSPSRADL